MNAKKLKHIRRLARQTFTEESRLLVKHGWNLFGQPTVQAVNDPKTQRGFYRMLKKTIEWGDS